MKPSCPICEEPSEDAYKPFCSRRCADIDLGRWMRDVYRVPAEEEDDAGDEDLAIEEAARASEKRH